MTSIDSLSVLLISTFTIAAVHTLAPDHWVPFVSIGRAQKWSKTKLTWVTLVCGIGHVGSSIVIGAVGLVLGFSLSSLESIESQRAQVAGLLLVGFGLAYAIWGIKHVRQHKHSNIDPKRSVTIWTIIAIFVLGPCEPLIPLMFVSAAHSWMAVWLVSLVFGLVTIVMMIGQALLAYLGISLVRLRKIEHYSHAVAGGVIAATGGVVMLFGI
jgi:sulfite exporter TauE/SafE